MNSINNRQNSVNFTAKMDISGVKTGAERLQNIAQMFETKTKKYPNDTFQLRDFGDSFQIDYMDKVTELEHCASIPTETWNKFLQKSDEAITKKLVKLFNIFKKEDREIEKAQKYIDSFIKNDKNNDPTRFESKFWDIVVARTNADKQIAVKKDPVLRDFDVD